jgi:alanine-synthesizing transaminase
MEFRRISNLPPYVFTIINNLKIEARRAGADVIDLGFGNPDIPSPEIAVDKLAEAAQLPRNHRYSLSRGLPKLREAIAGYYERTWGVQLDPELEITNTIGSKEGFSHLMWVLLDHDDAAIVPSPSYPIHIYGPLFAGADLRQVPMYGLTHPEARANFADDFLSLLTTAYDIGWPKPRVLVISFPHNPTGATVDLAFMQRVVDFCREREMVVVHDFAYADVGFDGVQPPSILQAEGAKECAVELYSMTKSFSMAGGGARSCSATPRWCRRWSSSRATSTTACSSPCRSRPPSPSTRRATSRRRCVASTRAGATRSSRVSAASGGTSPSPGVHVRVGAHPRAVRRARLGRVLLADGARLRRRAVAGPRLRARWRGYVRFALIENEKRIQQGIRNLKRGLTKLG